MERPHYNEAITRQNDVYAMDVIEKFRDTLKTSESLMDAITHAFIMGAGGYEGSFDAALVLEYGGMKVLLESLGLQDIDKDMSAPVDSQTFERAVRESVDFGAVWDEVEDEILDGSIGDTSITGENPFLGPIARNFVIFTDEGNR